MYSFVPYPVPTEAMSGWTVGDQQTAWVSCSMDRILRQECRAFLTHNTQTHPRSTTGIGHGGQDGGSSGMGLLGPL